MGMPFESTMTHPGAFHQTMSASAALPRFYEFEVTYRFVLVRDGYKSIFLRSIPGLAVEGDARKIARSYG